MTNKQILIVKCQKLVGTYNNERNVEMLISLEDGTPTEIMCGQYREGKCESRGHEGLVNCDFINWTKINRPVEVIPKKVNYGGKNE